MTGLYWTVVQAWYLHNRQWTVTYQTGETATASFRSNCNCILGCLLALLWIILALPPAPFHVCSQNESMGGCELHSSGGEPVQEQGSVLHTVLPGILTPLPLPSNQQPFLGSSISENQKWTPLCLELWIHFSKSFDFSFFSDTVGLWGQKS